MKGWKKRNGKQKHQFKNQDYCVNCQQRKSCGGLAEQKKYCYACYREWLEELEQEGLLISSAQIALNDYRQGVINCHCQAAAKPRVMYLNSEGSGWTVRGIIGWLRTGMTRDFRFRSGGESAVLGVLEKEVL